MQRLRHISRLNFTLNSFVYYTNQPKSIVRIPVTQSKPTTFFDMEAAQVDANSNIPTDKKKMTVRLVSRLKVELSLFRATLELNKSKLVEPILNPKAFPYCSANYTELPLVYKGYVSILIFNKGDA